MASSIVKSVAQQLGQLLVEEAQYLYKVREKIESLQMELKWMECFLRDADTRQHQEEVIRMWVSQVRDLTYEAEDTIERYLHQVSYHRRDGIRNTLKWFSHISLNCDALTMHKLGLEIDGLAFKLNELTSRLQRYGIKIINPIGSLDYKIKVMENRRTYSHKEEDVVGLQEEIKEVVNQLVDPKKDVKLVRIIGTGGLGKTTLARKVFKHEDVKYHFNNNRAWVYISKEFEKGSIFKQILLELEKGNEKGKEDINKLKVEQLPGKLHKLLQEKSCLIVLDDIWDEEAWKRLKPALESIFTTTSSSKILFTTRNGRLLQHDDDKSGYPHFLKLLSHEDSWELLKRKAFGRTARATPSQNQDIGRTWEASVGPGRPGGEPLAQGQDENEPQGGESVNNSRQYETTGDGLQDDDRVKDRDAMEQLGREMLQQCGGLPIAIVALGGILSTKKTVSEWEDVRANLPYYLMSDTTQGDGDDNKLFEVLELSYHELPYYLKPCFLYFGMFPEDHEISTQRLYHLWEAEGLLVMQGAASRKGRRTMYDVGETYLNELVQRSMVQVGEWWPSGRIKTCRVHDVMRDMCLRKCEEVSFLEYIECSTSADPASGTTVPAISVEINRLRRCALNDEEGGFFDKQLKHGERAMGLRSLIVFQDRKMSQKVWKCFPFLRVLEVEGIRLEDIEDVGELIHLRYLSLRETFIEVISSCVYSLKYVETLDLRVSSYGRVKLHNKFDKMKKLRHLYLPELYKVASGEKLKFPIGGQMETLENFDPKRCETRVLAQMTNLRVFSISKCSTNFETGLEVKAVLEAPLMKKGQLINSFRLPISGDVIREDPEILSSARYHPCFKELKIHRGSVTGVVFPERLTRVEIIYCRIGEGDVLSLEKLSHLESLVVQFGGFGKKLRISQGSVIGGVVFPQLTHLSITNQDELEEWEVGEGALPLLQSLELKQCRELSKVTNLPASLTKVELCCCKIGEGGVGLLSALENLPRLKSLLLWDISTADNKLSFSASSFPRLSELIFGMVRELKEWGVGVGALSNLQHLELDECAKLNKFENLPNSLTDVVLKDCRVGDSLIAELESLPCLHKLKITVTARAEAGVRNNKLSFSAASFPQLSELKFKRVSELEEWGVGVDALPNLQSLKIHYCGNLKECKVGDGALSNLQHLTLDGCKELNKFENLPNSLTDVKISSCRVWDSLIAELESLPCLHKLRISSPTVIAATAEAGGPSNNKLSFSAASFPLLVELHIECPPNSSKELELGDGALPKLQHLSLNGYNKLSRIPTSLTAVGLNDCEIGEASISLSALGTLPRLKQLRLFETTLAGGATKMSFSADAFPQLTLLRIYNPQKLVELDVGEGALSSLQRLELDGCSKLKRIPSGLPASLHIECRDPCIKGIKKYDTCPHFKEAGCNRFKKMTFAEIAASVSLSRPKLPCT